MKLLIFYFLLFTFSQKTLAVEVTSDSLLSRLFQQVKVLSTTSSKASPQFLQTNQIVTPLGMADAAMSANSDKKEEEEDDSPEPPAQLTESEAKAIVKEEIEPLRKDLKNQHQEITKSINKMGDKLQATMEETSKNMTKMIKKMEKKINKKIVKLQSNVQENTLQAHQLNLLMYQNQLEEKQEKLENLLMEIEQLKRELPPLNTVCDNYFACEECVSDPKCGWCSMEKKCVRGDDSGPLTVTCNFYDYKFCRGNNCGKFPDCESCISDPNCGWCNNRQTYTEGCIEQDFDYTGCPREGWFHIEGENDVCERRKMKKSPRQHRGIQRGSNQQTCEAEEEVIDSDDTVKRDSTDRTWEQNTMELKNRKIKQRNQKNAQSTPSEKKRLYKRKQLELQKKQFQAAKLKEDIKFLQKKINQLKTKMDIYDDEINQRFEEREVFEGEGEGEDQIEVPQEEKSFEMPSLWIQSKESDQISHSHQKIQADI